ncbi:OmpA/MotB family protein [Pararhodonellum marinum]|uniref:OmpA/MotB family protein n=1 Tax=Pararhodonellum marinum TaxID=2755358 RepID=UPI0018901382|nr:flagellar motor protein MotB [Pararhodonellum marinum]
MKTFTKNLILAVILSGLFMSCVSKKKFLAAEDNIASLSTQLSETQSQLADTKSELEKTKEALEASEEEVRSLKEQLGMAMDMTSDQQRMLTDKEKTLMEQQDRLNALQKLFDEQREVMNRLKSTVDRALNQYKSDELQVYEKDGKLYVALQDKLLFPSGSATVNRDGIEALGKLAEVLNNNPEIQVMVEGHTDNVPISGRFEDNWALSTARASSIVRVLTNTYKVTPERVIASGHSYFNPKESNDTAEGRAKNRRTEIILTPQLDELYKILN